MQSSKSGESRPLGILGLSEMEELIYDWLLTHSGASVSEVAQAHLLTPGKAQRLLNAIEAKGLVTRTPERPRRYQSVAPDIALRALALRGQESLQQAEVEIQRLQDKSAQYKGQTEHEQIVELITSHEAERQIFEQLHRAARHEILAMSRSPMRVSKLDVSAREKNKTQSETRIGAGVRYRGIVDAGFLSVPGATGRVRDDIKAGEEVRVFPHLPFKMVFADHRIALIPLNLEQIESPSLLIRSSALLDALYALFEMLWERATPISPTRTGLKEPVGASSKTSAESGDLTALLAAGLNDKTIAGELGLSMRTLTRRVLDLMQSLDARTRFQAGWQAALRQVDENADGRESKKR